MITLIGFLFPLLSYCLVFATVPHFTDSPPPWYCYLFGLGLFFYQTMDNVDGKQARATGTSSPLGELFDHGCDAVNVVITAVVTAAVLRLGYGLGTFGVILMGVVPFYFASWEEYHTGTLYLGVINGPTEGIVGVVGVALASGYFGSDFWLLPARDVLPGPALAALDAIGAGGWALNEVGVLCFSAPVIFTVAASVVSAVRKTKKGSGLALAQLIPFAVYVLSCGVWVVSAEVSDVSDAPDIVQPLVHYTVMTLVFGELVGRVITAHLLKLHFPVYGSPVLLIPIALAANSAALHWVADRGAAQAALVVAAFAYLHFVLHVISGFCAHLDIPVLTIPKAKA